MRAVVSRANAQQEGLSLSSPVGRLKRVSPHLEDLLARLEIRTVQDLLFHLPIRYQDRTRVAPIGTLQAGDEAVIEGEVLLTEIRYGRRRMLLSRLGDGTGRTGVCSVAGGDHLAAVGVGAVDGIEALGPLGELAQPTPGLRERLDAVVQVGQMALQQRGGVLARAGPGVLELDHAGDLGQGEPGQLGLPDERQALGRVLAVVPVPRRRTGSRPRDS